MRQISGKLFALVLCVICLLILFVVFNRQELFRRYSNVGDKINQGVDTTHWQVCNNAKAAYTFRFPANWYVYDEGSYGADMVFLGTSTCEGFGVSVSSEPPIPGIRQSGAQGINVRVDPEDTILQLPYVKQDLADRVNGGVASSQSIIEAYLGTTTLQWVSVDGVSFGFIGPWSNVWSITGLFNGKLYSISPDNVTSDMFKSLLSTFTFGIGGFTNN